MFLLSGGRLLSETTFKEIAMKILGVIPARMASSRFPGKPLALIAGKPMIEWVYENSLKSAYLTDLVIATDHEKIFDHCRKKDMQVIMTSPDNKNCSERTNEVSGKIAADYYAEIQGDEPVLSTSMIDDFISKSIACIHEVDLCISCTHIPPTEDINNINLVKITLDKAGNALFFSRLPIPLNFKNTHETYYKQIGLYFWKRDSLRKFVAIQPGPLEIAEDTHTLRLIENHFRVRMIYTPKATVSVDVPDDIRLVEKYLRESSADER